MSVNKNDINFSEAFDKAAGKTTPTPKKKEVNKMPPSDDAFSKAFDAAVKKKEDTPSLPPSKEPLDGAAPVPGTINTTNTIKWEDNPLNPVKAVNDYEAKRDKTPEILFKDSDNEQLNTLLAKHKVAPAAPVTKPLSWIEAPGQPQMQQPVAKAPMQIKYEDAVNLENTIKAQLENYKDVRLRARGIKKTKEEENAEKDLQEAQLLKRKAATELVVNGDKEIEVNTRTNEIGNSFNQFMSDLISLNQPVKGKKFNVKETEDKVRKMPTQFLTGLNMLKLTEPAEYERVTEAIANGLPVSASQTAKITALGLNIEQAKLERDILKAPITQQEKDKYAEVSEKLATIKPDIDKYEEMIKAKLTLSPEQVSDYNKKIQQYNQTYLQSKPLIEKINSIETAFSKKASELQEARRKNLIDNPEVLRAFISDGVAEKLDELGKIRQGVDAATGGKKLVSDFMFGHTWNYSPEQIKWAAENYLKEQGIDPTTKQAQDAIKFLQENEGIMIGENSIAKAGGFRELGEGIIEPITGTAKSIKDRYRSFNDIYAESQSQGNVDVAKKRLASEDTGIRSVVNDVLKGTGQFASQAAIMYATSSGIGAIAESILGKSGVEWLAQAKAANIKPVVAFDDASANLAAGKFLYGIKDPMAVFTTSFAMSYDGNLKAALSYTSDNTLAKRAAMFNASMEGATELFLSPLEIAQGIIHKFSKNQTKDLLKILSDKSLKDEPGALKEYVGKFVRGVLGTSKVAGAEIGEEFVTQISDYVTNMYLNPDSDSFKNRDLKQELMTTAYQTGLTMAVPAILNGIGAMKANSFSKGSLMIAAQNRQKIVDGINKDLAAGKISPEQANEQIQLVNTAAVANAQLPKKANGTPLNTDEKANYIWSLTTEAYMDKKMASMNDAASKEIWKDKITKQQEYRKQILGLSEAEPEVPEYTIDDKPVDRKEFLETAEAQPDDHNYVVTGDEEAQQVIRNIGGIDDENNKPPEKKGIPTDEELVAAIESKNVNGYTKTDIKELKEQALQAPASFKNQFGDDEATTVSLIAKNSIEKINKAIEYQQERLKDPDIDENEIEQIDGHIQLLEQGLKEREEFYPDEANKPEEGKPLSKLEQLKAKRLLAKEEVPGETIDQKLKHISDQPENFEKSLVELAQKRFPKPEQKGKDVVVDKGKVEPKVEPKVETTKTEEVIPPEPPKDHTVKTQPSGTEGKFTPVIINKKGEHEVLNKSFDTPEAAKVYGEETVKKRYFDENIKNQPEPVELPNLSQPIGENVPKPTDVVESEKNKELANAFPQALELNDKGELVERGTKEGESEFASMGRGILGYNEQYLDALKSNTNPKELDADKLNFLREKYNEGKIKSLVDVFTWGNKKGREIHEKYESSENKPEVKGQPEQITQSIEPKAETKSEGKTKREDAENKVITVGLSGSRSISDLIKETGKKYDYIDLGDGLVAFTTEPEGTVRTYTVADMKNPAKDGNVIGFSLHQNNKGELGTVNKSNIEMFAKANGQSADAIMARMDELKRKLELVSLEQKGKDVVDKKVGSIYTDSEGKEKIIVQVNHDGSFLVKNNDGQKQNPTLGNEKDLFVANNTSNLKFDKNVNKKQQAPAKGTSKGGPKSSKSTKPEKIKTFKKRAKATIKSPLYIKALDIESNDPTTAALQYFIAGGRVHRQALEKLFGGKKLSGKKNVESEIKAHFQLQSKHGPRSVERLGEDLWHEADDHTQEKYDSQAFINAVENALLEHNSRTSMAEALVKNAPKEENEWQNYYDQAHEGLDEDEQNQVDKAISILEGLTDEEIQQILDTEQEALADSDFLEQLSNQYDNPISKEQAEKDKKIAEIEKEKRDKIKQETKPDIQPEEQTKIEIEKLAITSEANRQRLDDIKQKLYSLRELVKCLWL